MRQLILPLLACILPLSSRFQLLQETENKGIQICYVEKEHPVAEAEFSLYQVGYAHTVLEGNRIHEEAEWLNPLLASWLSEEDSYCPSDIGMKIAEGEIAMNGAVYKGRTDENGNLFFAEPEEGYYVVIETKAAEGYRASSPFLIRYPQEGRRSFMKLSPKAIPCGELCVRKTVRGEKGEKDRVFHVKCCFEEESAAEYTYMYDDGTTGCFRSGEILDIKDSQTVTILRIPEGTAFTIKEQEADCDGYRTQIIGGHGRINGHESMNCEVINVRSDTPDTGDSFRKSGYAWAASASLILLCLCVRIFCKYG